MNGKKTLDLRQFKIPLGKLSSVEKFKTRSGDVLSYRTYSAWSENLIILYHGVGGDSRYMCVLASALAEEGLGTVITPDFRGHGASLGSSDSLSPHQLEIDLEELLIHIKMTRPAARVFLMGHSLGGGFALRVAVSDLRKQFAGFVALAPYLPLELKAFNEGAESWLQWNSDGGFTVQMEEIFRTGAEKLSYSAAYLKAVSPPAQILEDLKRLASPVTVIIGLQDEVASASRQQELFSSVGVKVHLIEGLNHLTLVSKPDQILPFIPE